MNKRSLSGATVLFLFFQVTAAVPQAHCRPGQVRLGLYLTPVESGGRLRREKVAIPICGEGELSVRGDSGILYNLDVYAMNLDPSTGLEAIAFGIDHSGVEILSWDTPALAQVHMTNGTGQPWPAAGSGNILVFSTGTPHANGHLMADAAAGVMHLGTVRILARESGFVTVTPPEAYGPSTGEECADPLWRGAIRTYDSDHAPGCVSYPDDVGRVVFDRADGAWDPCSDSVSDSEPQEAHEIAPWSSSVPVPSPTRESVVWELTSRSSKVATIAVYSVGGRLVRGPDLVRLTGGTTRITWDGRSDAGERLPSGVYFLVAAGGGYRTTQRAVLIR